MSECAEKYRKEHCWHEKRVQFTRGQLQGKLQRSRLCCWCGLFQKARNELVAIEGHGPHYKVWGVVWSEDEVFAME